MMRVAIDAGHGGVRNGIYATSQNYKIDDPTTWKKMWIHEGVPVFEGELNRIICDYLGKHLSGLGVSHFNIHEDYADTSLQNRVSKTKNNKADLFISIHNNAGGGEGFEIFTTKNKNNSDKFAETILKEVKPVLRKWDTKCRGHKEEDFQVIKGAPCPAVLVEVGFFDSPNEIKKLTNNDYLNDIAYAIAQGIKNFTIQANN